MRPALADLWVAFASWRAFRWLMIWKRRQDAAEFAREKHRAWLACIAPEREGPELHDREG
ncbi:hypothetical protein ABE438_17560 [Bosea sp. TWI1241]|uniref:hypothetical protein n=1 Tax=Bosea sp. TWI1241 TaxID=3148904 RepID=UPI003207A060